MGWKSFWEAPDMFYLLRLEASTAASLVPPWSRSTVHKATQADEDYQTFRMLRSSRAVNALRKFGGFDIHFFAIGDVWKDRYFFGRKKDLVVRSSLTQDFFEVNGKCRSRPCPC